MEAIPLKSTIRGQIINFLVEYIISRYGVPSKLFIDNGPSFKGNEIRNFGTKYHTKNNFSFPCYPQGNGQAEASNKIIKSILFKIVVKHVKDWHE